MYNEKTKNFQGLTRKMDKEDLVAMEDKLEKTAMGLLFDKEKYRTLSSKEQKVYTSSNASSSSSCASLFESQY